MEALVRKYYGAIATNSSPVNISHGVEVKPETAPLVTLNRGHERVL
jgi:hypothetical protein